jgi:UDP-glucuronate 4-epimerase
MPCLCTQGKRALWPLYGPEVRKGNLLQQVLVTGGAGFIGMHVCQKLLCRGFEVVAADNLNAYYEPSLKIKRIEQLKQASFEFRAVDLANCHKTAELFDEFRPRLVVHLAAQAGVRYSIENPRAYVESNLSAFVNVLEGCRHYDVSHLVYASSSSVYGTNAITPFSEDQPVDHPISLYAATKKANELMAHSYSHLYGLPTTGLRFFTVYGPWGRPDMAYFKFTRAILEGTPIDVYNGGHLRRDFTYIDDTVEGVLRVLDRPARPQTALSIDPSCSVSCTAPYRIYNIGNSSPVELCQFIEVLEQAAGRQAVRNYLPMQPGDMVETSADNSGLEREIGFRPTIPIEQGLPKFVDWYRTYYRQ